mmetsp:Transcript_9210/g.26372  ORF Transcript_9210/g.26372 Transcript_9210/m.26372 type:complete len:240 (-) Transcript_9210:353-1072(-)
MRPFTWGDLPELHAFDAAVGRSRDGEIVTEADVGRVFMAEPNFSSSLAFFIVAAVALMYEGRLAVSPAVLGLIDLGGADCGLWGLLEGSSMLADSCCRGGDKTMSSTTACSSARLVRTEVTAAISSTGASTLSMGTGGVDGPSSITALFSATVTESPIGSSFSFTSLLSRTASSAGTGCDAISARPVSASAAATASTSSTSSSSSSGEGSSPPSTSTTPSLTSSCLQASCTLSASSSVR